MKTFKKMRLVPLLLTLLLLVMMAAPTMSMADQPIGGTVRLGTASTFAVLAGSTITNTGTTWIGGNAGGNVGVHPGSAFTGLTDVTLANGANMSEADALQAQNDLITALTDTNAAGPVTQIPTELGGQALTPGVYDSADGTFGITGTLTLNAGGDPNAVFIFKTATTLISADAVSGTTPNSNVVLTGGALPCHVFWQVGSSATLGTYSNFVGHIFAYNTITANTGATVKGQLLAQIGAVNLHGNTITNGGCAILHVIKHVINDNGHTSVAADFNLHVKTSGSAGKDVFSSPAPGAESPGTTYTLAAGTYVVSEDTVAGYTVSYSGDGDSSGNITLSLGDSKTVTVTNTANASGASSNNGGSGGTTNGSAGTNGSTGSSGSAGTNGSANSKTGDCSMNTEIILLVLAAISAIVVFVTRKKVTNK